MPQLNPAPWFLTFLMTWLTLTLLMQPKLLSLVTTNPPLNKMPTANKATSWTWPWT
uniref:ATP synthase complex subunit 8 n=1 Tax=Anhinga anhinga TaxID=56067 RepID=A0A7L8DBC7_ANHAN|nr:ATP synthase F0 subunit 8 [Anhinga anhinga]